MKPGKKLTKLAFMTVMLSPMLFGCVDTGIDTDYKNTLENGGAYYSEIAENNKDDSEYLESESKENVSEARIISLFEIEVEDSNINDKLKVVEKEAHDLGGYISSHALGSKSSHDSSEIKAEISYRIPKSKAGEFIKKLKERVNVTVEKSHSIDVSEELLDIQANIEGLSMQEERLNKLIENASSTDEALKIDEKLSEINKEKKALELKDKSIDERSSYSRINLTIYEVSDKTSLLSRETVTVIILAGMLGASIYIKTKSNDNNINIDV